jgi:hypothetical protein
MPRYNVRAPALPLPTPDYLQAQQDQFQNALRLYFNRLDEYLTSLSASGSGGGSQLYFPYGAFSSFQDQTTTANTATLMTLDTTDFANGIYNLQFSTQFQNTDNQLQDMSIWLRQGSGAGSATDIVGSTGFVSIPAKAGAIEAHEIVGWNYYVSMNANDYIQIYWSTTDADVTIQTYPASVSPTRPSTASVVATMTFVSAL